MILTVLTKTAPSIPATEPSTTAARIEGTSGCDAAVFIVPNFNTDCALRVNGDPV